MNTNQKIACARDMVTDLDRIGKELAELVADAEACHFHTAALRLGRTREIIGMVGPALKRSATILETLEAKK